MSFSRLHRRLWGCEPRKEVNSCRGVVAIVRGILRPPLRLRYRPQLKLKALKSRAASEEDGLGAAGLRGKRQAIRSDPFCALSSEKWARPGVAAFILHTGRAAVGCQREAVYKKVEYHS